MRELFIVSGIILAVFVLIFATGNWYGSYVCLKYSDRVGMETYWQTFDTCYVKHNGEWLRYSAYEKVITARDGLKG